MNPIYCDNHILVVEKPSGIATQPTFHEETRSYVKKAFAKPGNVFLEPIHRLDKPVSGMVLFARTSKALSRLNEAMREKRIQKFYLALVEGHLPDEGTLEHTLLHAEHRALVDPKGKKALLHYRCVEKREENSLVEIELKTGRYHQIRCQFGAIGHPIVGDKKYGSKTAKEAICLHHHKLIVPHPTKGEELTLESSSAICTMFSAAPLSS